MTTTPVRMVIVGGGRMGELRWTLSQGVPDLVCVGIVEVFPAGRPALEAKGIPVFSTLAATLDDVDGVWVAATTAAHVSLVKEAAAAGKHVVCEKPLAFTEDEIRDAYTTVRQCNTYLSVAWTRRSDAYLKKAVDFGLEGGWHTAHIITRDNPTPPAHTLRHMGDLWSDLTVHDFDLALALSAGEAPRSVTTVGCSAFGTNVVDKASTILEFSGGKSVTIDTARSSSSGYHVTLEVATPKGVLDSRMDDEKSRRGEWYSFPDRFEGAFRSEIVDFSHVLLRVRKDADSHQKIIENPPAWGTEQYQLLVNQMVAAAHESAMTGRKVHLNTGGSIPMRFIGYGSFAQGCHAILRDNPPLFTILPEHTRKGPVSWEGALAPVDGSNMDAVHICTPDDAHDDQVLACLLAGKAVLVEKPLKLDMWQEIKMAAMTTFRPFLIGFHRRFSVEFDNVRKIISTTPPNVVHFITEEAAPVEDYRNPDVARRRVLQSVIHDIDFLNWCFPRDSIIDITSAVEEGGVLLRISGTVTYCDKHTVDVVLTFAPGKSSYLQTVVVDGVDHCCCKVAEQPTAAPWLRGYRDAYWKQYKYFHGMITGIHYHKDLLTSYDRTFVLLRRVLHLLCP